MSNQGPVFFGGAEKLFAKLLNRFISIGIVVGLVCISIPHLINCRELSSRTACGTNLNAVAKSCLIYGEGNRGRSPLNLEALCLGGERAYFSSKQVVCPVSKLPYILMPRTKTTELRDAGDVLAYEPASYHKGAGGNVAFLDGSVKWYPNPEVVVAQTKARLRNAATRPMQ